MLVKYGRARLGSGSHTSDNGNLTGNSQYAALTYTRPVGAGLQLQADAQWQLNQLQTHRALNFGDVHQSATADNGQQQLAANVQLDHTYHAGNWQIAPAIGMAWRQTRDDAVAESGADLYNLNVTGNTSSALDMVAGIRLSYADQNGWNGHFNLLGGPSLLYRSGIRSATLAGAPQAQFLLAANGQRSPFNYSSTLGVDYQSGRRSFSLDGYASSQDTTNDYGVMARFGQQF
ncbi:hypothetical protein JCM19000A_36130 [Silvimonas sp. JCM 19000]